MKKLDKKIFHNKLLVSTKMPNPILETRVSKLVFITIPWLKFWAQSSLHAQVLQYTLLINNGLLGTQYPWISYTEWIVDANRPAHVTHVAPPGFTN